MSLELTGRSIHALKNVESMNDPPSPTFHAPPVTEPVQLNINALSKNIAIACPSCVGDAYMLSIGRGAKTEKINCFKLLKRFCGIIVLWTCNFSVWLISLASYLLLR